MFRTHRILLFAVSAAIFGATASIASAGDDKGFKDLFNGKDLDGWKYFPEKADKTYTVEDGYIKVSGKPNGYFYTDKSYKNYVLKFDWRYKRPADLQDDKKFGGNSGLLVHITGKHNVWPNSLEVQGMNRDHGSFLSIGKIGLTEYKFNREALEKARNKVGEWNTTEVSIKNGEVSAKVNGALISTGKITLVEGPFGFQSEGAELHFKNIKIKVLADGPAPKSEDKKTTKTDTKSEEKRPTTIDPPKTKVDTKPEAIAPPATKQPQPASQVQYEYVPERRGLFPNLRARLRLFR